MAKQKPTTKICKHCKTEIPYGAKICPNCRKKQSSGLVWKIIVAIVVLGIIGAIFGGDDSSSKSNTTAKDTYNSQEVLDAANELKEAAEDLKESAEAAKDQVTEQVNEEVKDAVEEKAKDAADSLISTLLGTNKSEEAPEDVEYIQVSVDEMFKILKDNALKAKNTYDGQYVEVTGYLANIDSSGKYIDLNNGDSWSFDFVQCYVKGEEIKNQVAELSNGQKLTVRGKVIDVGEVLGYSLNIIEFVQ